jgi:hypothetical protein
VRAQKLVEKEITFLRGEAREAQRDHTLQRLWRKKCRHQVLIFGKQTNLHSENDGFEKGV